MMNLIKKIHVRNFLLGVLLGILTLTFNVKPAAANKISRIDQFAEFLKPRTDSYGSAIIKNFLNSAFINQIFYFLHDILRTSDFELPFWIKRVVPNTESAFPVPLIMYASGLPFKLNSIW